jgi:hypothetical protein
MKPKVGANARRKRRPSITTTPSDGRLQQIGALHTERDGQRLDVVECEVDEPGLDLAGMRAGRDR